MTALLLDWSCLSDIDGPEDPPGAVVDLGQLESSVGSLPHARRVVVQRRQ